MRTPLSQASSCHLRKIKILLPGDKACCARDRYSSDSQPEVINPEKNVTHLPERLPCRRRPTGSGFSLGRISEKGSCCRASAFSCCGGVRAPQIRTSAYSVPARKAKAVVAEESFTGRPRRWRPRTALRSSPLCPQGRGRRLGPDDPRRHSSTNTLIRCFYT